MSIIETLQERSTKSSDDVKIDLKLYNLADDLEKQVRTHLKRIVKVLPEFDLHDETHSEKVLSNIEQLLGKETIESLSSYELFLLHLSAFMHDCAMAPSDWEINMLKLTEGTDEYKIVDNSLKNDLKPPFKFSSAIEIVKQKKKYIYIDFESDVKKWIFSPETENELNEYLSKLLVEYQNFRNGFADKIKNVKSEEEFKVLNDFIRIDFIRRTHHLRIEDYIKNLGKEFRSAFEQPAWGEKLSIDLALVCRAHREDISFISKLDTKAQYYESESANLQFIAIMLRLGDVIHYSFDRAPIELRSSRLFKSDYSFQEWAVKNNGVNYNIQNGIITYRAYCDLPELYFKLHKYLDWIEQEILNYFSFERKWDKKYKIDLNEIIDRTNINNNKDKFEPKRGLGFSLNQKRIIELLMGVGLYKDKYACLRELYQNSLDACRCMLSKLNKEGRNCKGIIEFSLQKENGKTYLCCRDNGIGMTKEIIETYLLHIGNSYYKSSDFYKQQAQWGGSFTPTSQFGIGILSCFMLGDKIEITSKVDGGEYISCAIDGPYENFYYKKISEIEKERINNSGTIVRILLNKEIESELTDNKIEKLGLLLFRDKPNFIEGYNKYSRYYEKWENHLYYKINNFVGICPEDIEVQIALNNNEIVGFESKPIVLDSIKLGFEKKDYEFIDYLNNQYRTKELEYKYSEIKELVECYDINVVSESIQYKTVLVLPKIGYNTRSKDALHVIPIVGHNSVCIDGIVSGSHSVGFENDNTRALIETGIINFTGELRPQLSVDKSSIIKYPKECESEAEILVGKMLKEVVNITKTHIEKHNITPQSSEIYTIWEYILEKFEFALYFIVNEIATTEYSNILWKDFEKITGKKLSISNFLTNKYLEISNYDYSSINALTQRVVLVKLMSATKIEVKDNVVKINTGKIINPIFIYNIRSFTEIAILTYADEWNSSISDYDIISSLYPIIPLRLFNKIKSINDNTGERTKVLRHYSNGFTAFFNQDPLLIHQSLGVYYSKKGAFRREKSKVYNFEKKRNLFQLFDINKFDNKNKEKFVLFIYISPRKLSASEKIEMKKYKENVPTYYKGVNEGWSILITGMNENNIIIIPGKCSREEIVNELPDSFWEKYSKFTFSFTDNTPMKKTR